MAHSVGEQAARAVKNSERKQVQETRTPEEIIGTLRKNIPNPYIAILKTDVAVLMAAYDAAQAQLAQYHATAAARVEPKEFQTMADQPEAINGDQ
jgi:hypothetical protein